MFTLLKRIYWKYIHKNIKDRYTLTCEETSAEFQFTNRTEMNRNIGRYNMEKPILSFLLRNIKKDDVIYDIGANTGLYSSFCGRKCSEGLIVSVEPLIPNVLQLKENLLINCNGRYEIIQVALSNESNVIKTNIPGRVDPGFGKASIMKREKKDNKKISIPTIKGDTLLNTVAKPNIAKIDVEGAESLVISGMKNALSSNECRILICEIHTGEKNIRPSISDFGTNKQDIINQIRSVGFTNIKIIERDGEETIIGKKYDTIEYFT
jgi:FkbM family methyltransferase